jgi:hypothetical protein
MVVVYLVEDRIFMEKVPRNIRQVSEAQPEPGQDDQGQDRSRGKKALPTFPVYAHELKPAPVGEDGRTGCELRV